MAGGNVPPGLAPVFRAAGAQYHIPANVLAGIASVETNLGQNKSTSSAGAVGLMQFLPSTARSVGIDPYNDRQAIFGAAKLLNQYGYQQNPTRAIGAYNGGPGNPQYSYAQLVLSESKRLASQLGGSAASTPGPPAQSSSGMPSVPQVQLGQKTVFDKQGYQQENKRYILGQFLKGQGKSPFDIGPKVPGLSTSDNPLFSLGILPSTPPNQADFTSTKLVQLAHSSLQQLAGTKLSPHPSMTAQASSSVAAGKFPTGVTSFGGKPVAKWIAPILAYAKQHGWTGSVTSGYRSYADQKRIYDSGVRPAAVPGTSNHEMDAFPGGAVDVTNASQLSAILQRSPYASVLIWAGSKDPVHFSHPHNGGY